MDGNISLLNFRLQKVYLMKQNGYSIEEIALALNVKPKTVAGYLHKIDAIFRADQERQELYFLSERQRVAYTMKKAGASDSEIAEKISLPVSSVSRIFHAAENRVRRHNLGVQRQSEENTGITPSDFTHKELKIIRAALLNYSSGLITKAPQSINADSLRQLMKKVDHALYGKPDSPKDNPPSVSVAVPDRVSLYNTEQILHTLQFLQQLIDLRMADLISASGFEAQVMSLRQMRFDLWLYYFDKQISFGSLSEKQQVDLLRYLLYNLTAADSTPASLHHSSMTSFPAYRAYMEHCFGIQPEGHAAFWLILGTMPSNEHGRKAIIAGVINPFVVFMLLLEQYLTLFLPDGGFGGKANKYTCALLNCVSQHAGGVEGQKVFDHAELLKNPLIPDAPGQG